MTDRANPYSVADQPVEYLAWHQGYVAGFNLGSKQTLEAVERRFAKVRGAA